MDEPLLSVVKRLNCYDGWLLYYGCMDDWLKWLYLSEIDMIMKDNVDAIKNYIEIQMEKRNG